MSKEKKSFYINNQAVEADANETIWQVAKRLGIEFPHLCHSPEPSYRPDGTVVLVWLKWKVRGFLLRLV